MLSYPSTNGQLPPPLVDAKKLLEILFEESSRPSLRWLRELQARREIPFTKRGRLIFFNPVKVLESFENHPIVKPGIF